MDLQVKSELALGNGVVDTKSYLPLIAVKNGQSVTMFTDGFIDFSNVPKLTFPDSRFNFLVKFYLRTTGTNEAVPIKVLMVEAGRTEVELALGAVYYVTAELIIKENQ